MDVASATSFLKDRPPMKQASPDAADVFAALDAENDEDPEAAS
jgi:hypothetical protein